MYLTQSNFGRTSPLSPKLTQGTLASINEDAKNHTIDGQDFYPNQW